MSKEKQIEEMAHIISFSIMKWANDLPPMSNPHFVANALYNAGYRKQSEGEWKRIEINGANYGQVYYQHKDCEVNETQLFPSPYNFCPNCGAKMKGGAE